MNAFKSYHPIVNFIYFAAVIGFSMFFMHPLYLAASFISAFTYSVVLSGKRAFRRNIIYMLPVLLCAALLNPAFNHAGVTVLTYLPSGNPLTLESIFYGLAAAVMLVSVICWFSCYNEVMTSDKFIYLFGRIIPSLSLVFSMALRFIPRFKAQLAHVVAAQKSIGRDIKSGNMIKKAKGGLNILSVMITWALENSIDTADSMKARGYGIPGRTAFSLFRFDKRDASMLFYIITLAAYVLVGAISGANKFSYFPSISTPVMTFYHYSILLAYIALCITPVIIELLEEHKWKAIESKI